MKDETDINWKAKLTPEQYSVLREKGTEAPFSGEALPKNFDGDFTCVACGTPLFSGNERSEDDIKSLSGWPGFSKAIPGAVEYHEDTSLGMVRTEVTCANCGGHLGHVFEGEHKDQKHYCINSVCLDYDQKAQKK